MENDIEMQEKTIENERLMASKQHEDLVSSLT